MNVMCPISRIEEIDIVEEWGIDDVDVSEAIIVNALPIKKSSYFKFLSTKNTYSEIH